MRFLHPLLIATLLTACGPAEQAAPGGDEPETSGPTLADFAGTWDNEAMIEGVADPVPSTLHGSASASGWTMDLEGRPGLPLTVSIVGDSLIVESGQYESVLREGVMVSIRTAVVLENGAMVGKMMATYETPDGEEVVYGTMRATRN
ncbi:MAG: hypothetical protein OEO23_09990 [Gemmatimonadota bacterium]|nr:hypothetical protein [Gemmatimonadota bacterium]